MKYCPYCGASLVGGAASFCSECGKPLPYQAKPSAPSRKPQVPHAMKPKQPLAGSPQPSGSRQPRNAASKTKPQRASTRFPARRAEPPRKPKPDPRDEGYDGYYDDVNPIDNGHTHDRMDPELMKRIIIVAAGAFVIVVFAIILMYVL